MSGRLWGEAARLPAAVQDSATGRDGGTGMTTTSQTTRSEHGSQNTGTQITAQQSSGRSFGEIFDAITASVAQAIHGKHDVIAAALTCLLAEGHLLVEDVPGVGQDQPGQGARKGDEPGVRPDPVHAGPAAVRRGRRLGVERPRRQRRVPAPARCSPTSFSATRSTGPHPKTQSALLEAMEERQVTVDGTTRPLPDPFMVVATQNPLEHQGTFPLPESQLDRFLMRLSVGYPDTSHEVALLTETDHNHSIDRVAPVGVAGRRDGDDRGRRRGARLRGSRRLRGRPGVAQPHHAEVVLGMSPRASLGLLAAARVRAAANGTQLRDPRRREAPRGPRARPSAGADRPRRPGAPTPRGSSSTCSTPRRCPPDRDVRALRTPEHRP